MFVYIQSEPRLWTVGHYSPDGTWRPESDHATPESAAKRTAWLNGGRSDNSADPKTDATDTKRLLAKIEQLESEKDRLYDRVLELEQKLYDLYSGKLSQDDITAYVQERLERA